MQTRPLPPDLALEIAQLGSTVRSNLTCPACHGGKTREGSLSIWRDGSSIIMKCWRLSCGYSQKLHGTDGPVSEPTFYPRECDLPMQDLNLAEARHLYEKYGVTLSTLKFWGIKQAGDGYWLPVISPWGSQRGGILRSTVGNNKRAAAYKQTPETWQSWYMRKNAEYTVIVEDQISAMRIWQLGWTAVALLGTNLSADKLKEIKQFASGQVLLVLDKDAFSLACKYTQRNYSLLPMKAILLGRDIKDIDDAEIIERLTGGRTTDSRSVAEQSASL